MIRTAQRDRIRTALADQGIATDIHYPIPDHRQECARGTASSACALPVTEASCGEVLTLPCFPEMRDEEVALVAASVRQAI